MSFHHIPLHQLVASDANVRRTDRKADIDTLAASILSHGLLQNLSVQPRGENRFEVVAGGRRHAALKALAKAGQIARDYPVPCNIIDPDGAAETSLAENVQRLAMNAMDEADAFRSLIDENLTADDVARRFGVTTRHVEQRLALSGLSPKVKAAYRHNELNLDCARAFCIEPDHAKQDAVLKALGKPVTHPGQVRALLTQGALKVSDRLVLFVGLQAYEEAGGAVTRDLFDPDTIFISDPDLVARLADERLERIRTELTEQGWGWVDVAAAHAGLATNTAQRIHPTRRPMTRAERKRLATLDERITALDSKLEDEDIDDTATWQEREALDSERQALIAQTQEWDKDLIALAGVMVRIDHDGRPRFTYGLVEKTDQAKLKRLLASRAPEGAANETDQANATADAPPDAVHKLPKSIARELTASRAAALRAEVAAAPDIALALAVHALLVSAQSSYTASINLRLDAPTLTDLPSVEAQREAVLATHPAGAALLTQCLAMNREELMDLLALLVATSIDVVHDAHSTQDRNVQAFADQLAIAVGLDMKRYWSADVAFLSRLSKSMLMDILTSSATVSSKRPKQREGFLRKHAKLKRNALAEAVSRTMDTAWLPDLLVTPVAPGDLVITEAGEAAISSIAAQ